MVRLNDTRPHPGYFWLAYDWDNLLPSCILCNQLNRTPTNELIGKGNRFPTVGQHATAPGEDLEAEQPLLLNPLKDDPAEHLVLDPTTGILGGKTEKGKTTIAVLGLNREGLLTYRKQTYQNVIRDYAFWLTDVLRGLPNPAPPLPAEVVAHKNGIAPFSFVGRCAVRDAQKAITP